MFKCTCPHSQTSSFLILSFGATLSEKNKNILNYLISNVVCLFGQSFIFFDFLMFFWYFVTAVCVFPKKITQFELCQL